MLQVVSPFSYRKAILRPAFYRIPLNELNYGTVVAGILVEVLSEGKEGGGQKGEETEEVGRLKTFCS